MIPDPTIAQDTWDSSTMRALMSVCRNCRVMKKKSLDQHVTEVIAPTVIDE
jgi:hypothetical protein